jgi:hypothetical protein
MELLDCCPNVVHKEIEIIYRSMLWGVCDFIGMFCACIAKLDKLGRMLRVTAAEQGGRRGELDSLRCWQLEEAGSSGRTRVVK